MIDPREYGPRAHEYGEVYQALVSITIGYEDRIWGRDVLRIDQNTFEIDGESTSAAGACEIIIEQYDGPPDGEAWSGGFAENH